MPVNAWFLEILIQAALVSSVYSRLINVDYCEGLKNSTKEDIRKGTKFSSYEMIFWKDLPIPRKNIVLNQEAVR